MQTNGSPQPASQQPGPSQPAPRSGGLPWGLGFIAFIPALPVTALAAAITMVVVGARQRRQGGIDGAVGRQAANWGLTYLLVSVLAWTVVGATIAAVETGIVDESRIYLAPVTIGAWALVHLAHFLCCLLGLVQAARGRVFRCWIALPLLSAR